jgi:hypothetical protein
LGDKASLALLISSKRKKTNKNDIIHEKLLEGFNIRGFLAAKNTVLSHNSSRIVRTRAAAAAARAPPFWRAVKGEPFKNQHF